MPEGIATRPATERKGRVAIDAERCKGCGLCAMACHRDVLVMSDHLNSQGYTLVEMERPERCTGCGLCAWMCPDVAIEVFRQK